MADGRFQKPVHNAVIAAVVVICHIVLATVVIIGIKGLELLIHYFWGLSGLRLFDQFPLNYLFHAMDTGIILIFGWNGLKEAAQAFRE